MNRARDEYIRIVYSKGMQVYLLKHTIVSYEPQASKLDIQGMDATLSGQSYTKVFTVPSSTPSISSDAEVTTPRLPPCVPPLHSVSPPRIPHPH